jgi:hypothetical protein
MATRDRDLDAIVEAIKGLTLQVSRLAWAAEASTRGQFDAGTYQEPPCSNCGSTLVPLVPGPASYTYCLACLEPKEAVTNG